MRHTMKIYAIPLWPLVKNVFLISVVVVTLSMLILAFFWMGLMREFATQLSDPQMGVQFDTLRHISSIFIFIIAIVNGVVSSFFITLFTGLAALIYNWLNRRYGGLEFEVSLPEMTLSTQSQMEENPSDAESDESEETLDN